jgi:mannosyl-oligosaccharide alpha-1,2-mannosidase
MTPNDANVLFPGDISSNGKIPLSQLKTEPRAQHLSCFAGGMVALGAKVFGQPDDLQVAQQLVDGCIWGYKNGHLGIMPEIMHMTVCEDQTQCSWDENQWQQEVEKAFPSDGDYVQATDRAKNPPRGVSKVDDPRYLLRCVKFPFQVSQANSDFRPETIESIFIMYRITGNPRLVETAWDMFNTIIQHTATEIAHTGLRDCTVDNPPKSDSMESFWLAETLKYFYLMFAEPDVVSLDEYVLNTEAHPFRRSV